MCKADYVRVLHPHPETVTAALFQDSAFFDPDDLIQVKYEMLRRSRPNRPRSARQRTKPDSRGPLFIKPRQPSNRVVWPD